MHTHKSWQDWSILIVQNSSNRNGASDDKQSISNPIIVSGNGKEELIPKFIQILFYDKYHKQTSTIWSIQHRLMSREWLCALLWGIFPLSTRSSSMVGAYNYNKSSNGELIQFQLCLCFAQTHTLKSIRFGMTTMLESANNKNRINWMMILCFMPPAFWGPNGMSKFWVEFLSVEREYSGCISTAKGISHF